MKRLTAIATATAAAVLLLALTIGVGAQDLNPLEKTYLTFSGPVELPGMTLQAGTYTFKLADTPSRNVVQVMSQDEKQVLGQFLFVQATRPDASGETVVTFRETAGASTTPAVHYWYYPNERIGKEFVYPKDQAARIAARTGEAVLSTEGEIGPNSQVSSIDAQGKVSPWERQNRTETTPPAASATNSVQGSGVAGSSAPGSSQAAETSAAASAREANPSLGNPTASTSVPAQPSAPAGSLAGNRGVQQPSTSTASSNVAADAQASRSGAVGTSGDQTPAAASSAGTARQADPSATDTGAARRARARELPKTASQLPLAGLIGLLSLAGAVSLRASRRA